MNELGAARVIYAYANRRTQGNDSARSDNTSATTSIVYGTVAFVGDGETSYTYTAADGTKITTTPSLGEYAVLLDSGETVFITSQIPLNVGDRVTLTYSNGMYALTANQSTAAYVQKSAADIQRETIGRITKEGDEIRSETETKVAVVQNSLDDFKKDHQLTDDDITKKVTDTKSETTTEYEAAISAYDKEVTARYKQAISDSEESTKTDYTKAISDATADTDSKVTAAQNAADAANAAAGNAQSAAEAAQKSADDASTAADNAGSEVEKLRTNVETNYLLKATYDSGIKGLEDSFSENYVSKADQDTLNADFDSRIKANATNISTEVSSRESAIDNLDTKAQGYASDAEKSAKDYTDGEVSKQNETIGAIKESQSSLQQESDSIKSDVATKWTTIQKDYATNDTVAKEYATKSELEQTSTGLTLQIEGTVSDVAIEYATGTSSTTPPTDGWSTSSPTWSKGMYVWQRTTTYATITNDDGTTTKKELKQTTACIQGADGDPGNDGRSVKSIVTQYTRSNSSSVNRAYGGWSTTCPSYSDSYPFYWTRQLITYTDDTTAYAPNMLGTYNGGLSNANSTAVMAADNANEAKSVTTRFGFDNNGMSVDTSTSGDGSKDHYVMTYGSTGISSMNKELEIDTPSARLEVKNWGLSYNNNRSNSDNSTAALFVTTNATNRVTAPMFHTHWPGGKLEIRGPYSSSSAATVYKYPAAGLWLYGVTVNGTWNAGRKLTFERDGNIYEQDLDASGNETGNRYKWQYTQS